jgi:hypothetical protein
LCPEVKIQLVKADSVLVKEGQVLVLDLYGSGEVSNLAVL